MTQRRSYVLSILVLLVISWIAILSASAQSNYGAVRGIISDAQGAIISDAKVLLTSESKKIARTTETNGSGEYVFSAVEPGSYRLSVGMTGFKQFENSGIIVDSGNTIPLDVKLELGSTSQSVEVNASEPLVNNATSYNGQLIDSQKLENLPNPGRNPFLFSKLDNNVTPVGDPRFVRFQDQSGSSTISIAGAPISSNNYAIDGIPITDFFNRAVIIPSIEAVEEVKIQANTYDAEIGRTSGGMFNTTLKSGSSVLHGVLQGETRQTNWGANLFFNNRTPYTVNGITYPTTPRGAAEFYSYVGALGGPIPLPQRLGGKDKTFFWIAEEGYRQRSPLTSNNSFVVPTALERQGNFSEIGNVVNGTCVTGRCIYDPLTSTTITNSAGKQVVVRTPFEGNIIPASRLNSVGTALAKAFPLPNTPVTSYGSFNFNGGDTLGDRADEFDGKIDHQFGARWLADFYYLHYGSKEPGGNALGTVAGSSSSYLLYRKVDAMGIQNTITLNPSTVLTVGFGFNRFPNDTKDISAGFNQATLGLPTSYVSALGKTGFPRITTDANLSNEGTSNSGPAVFFSRNFVTGIAKSLGKHNLKAGYVFRAISLTYTSLSDSDGTYSFDNIFTSADNVSSGSGATAADMVLGYPTSGAVITPTPLAITTAYNALYLQDDFRVTPKLTLNLGIRYEHEPGVHERSNHYSVGFDRNVSNPLTVSSGVTTFGGVEFAGQNGYKTTTGDMGSKFSPRAGFAYQLNESTVVRGGYGVFFMPLIYTNNAALAPGYVATSTYVATNGGGLPANNLANPFPGGLSKPSGSSAGYLTGVGSTLTVIDQGRRAPGFDSYSADIEHDFSRGIALKIGYVGGHGRNLANTINLNQLGDGFYSQGSTLTSAATNPYYKKGGAGAIGGATVSENQLLRPFPAFAGITDFVSDGVSNYNALDIKLQKRFSHGLSVLTAYTWSSNWDNLWGAGSTLNPGNNGPQDIYNLAPEYSRAINDMPNRFTLSTTYELPFGRGKMLLGNSGRLLDLLVGGWTFNDISILQSGSPLAITQATNVNSGLGNSTTRPTLVAGTQGCYSGSPEGRLGAYFNKAAYTTTPAFSYGTAPRTSNCYGPGYTNSDLSLNKSFKATERVTAEFRAEALNAFNTPEFNAPNLAIGNKSVGQITGTLGFPRLVQLGGRLMF